MDFQFLYSQDSGCSKTSLSITSFQFDFRKPFSAIFVFLCKTISFFAYDLYSRFWIKKSIKSEIRTTSKDSHGKARLYYTVCTQAYSCFNEHGAWVPNFVVSFLRFHLISALRQHAETTCQTLLMKARFYLKMKGDLRPTIYMKFYCGHQCFPSACL